jgi:homoserine O-succinyltransferase
VPIRIPSSLPAKKTLESEHIFIMTELRAKKQDIRPLRILILNLMPTKITTETQLIRLLSNSPLQVEITLLKTARAEKHTPAEHMEAFYKTFDDIREEKFDGMIITGAPVETLAYDDITYWRELCDIMEWGDKHVYSTLYICWAAQAGLYYKYGIEKKPLEKKLSGIFAHTAVNPKHPLLRGFNDVFYAPHSRYTYVSTKDIKNTAGLSLLAVSKEAGAYIAASSDSRHFFVTGHAEYDTETLKGEYERDLAKGINPAIPENYFPDDDPSKTPLNSWRSHANLLFVNWLNYFVYQKTPYNINTIGAKE